MNERKVDGTPDRIMGKLAMHTVAYIIDHVMWAGIGANLYVSIQKVHLEQTGDFLSWIVHLIITVGMGFVASLLCWSIRHPTPRKEQSARDHDRR